MVYIEGVLETGYRKGFSAEGLCGVLLPGISLSTGMYVDPSLGFELSAIFITS